MIGRAVAWILLILALIAAGRDGLLFLQTGAYNPSTLGEIWYALDRNSLNSTQTTVESLTAPWLWEAFFFPLLVGPAWAVVGTTGLLVGVICGRGGKRRRRNSLG